MVEDYEVKPENRTIFMWQVFSGVRLLAKGMWGLVGFLVRHPTKLPAGFKFVVQMLPRYLLQKLRSSVQVDEERLRMKQQLLCYAGVFEEIKDRLNLFDLRTLESNSPEADSRWLLVYLLIRALKPKVVVETGVATGESTSHILQALSDNGKGILYSIDMPFQWYISPKDTLWVDILPIGEQPGYLVPDELRARWTLILGRSCEKLPPLLESLGEIDLFLHDSEHTYENMTFEFNCAWTHIRTGGFLVTDDPVWEGNTAFHDFVRNMQAEFAIIEEIGVIHKP